MQKAFGETFKGTKAEYDRIMAEAVETSKRLGEVAKVSQSEFNALGTTAAATFAGMIKETGDLYGAMKAIEPTLNNLIRRQEQWGLQGDETFNSLMKFQRVIKENEGIFQSLERDDPGTQGAERSRGADRGDLRRHGPDGGREVR